jgi:hypothetical protein
MVSNAVLVAVSLVLSQAKAPAGKQNDAAKAAAADAVSKALTDAPAKEKKPGPDVSKMPFTPDSVKAVVVAFQPQIQKCYEEMLAAKDKAIEGRIETAFNISPDGITTGAKVDAKKSTIKDAQLHDCVLAVLSTMEFPKPPDGKSHPIRFPFSLKPQQ